jgi:hypothetical protein
MDLDRCKSIELFWYEPHFDVDSGKRLLDEFANRVGLASSKDKVLRIFLLKDEPHALDIITGYKAVQSIYIPT